VGLPAGARRTAALQVRGHSLNGLTEVLDKGDVAENADKEKEAPRNASNASTTKKRDLLHVRRNLEIFNTFNMFASNQRFSGSSLSGSTNRLPPNPVPPIIAATNDDEVPYSPVAPRGRPVFTPRKE
jgi:hypothetical protein